MMKQFYTVALMGLAVLTMNAGPRTPLTSAPEGLNVTNAASRLEMPAVSKVKKAPAAKTLEDFCGTYSWSFFNPDVDENGQQIGEERLITKISIADAAKGLVKVAISDEFAMTATVDLVKGTMTLANKQFLGTDEYGKIYFYVKSVGSDGKVGAGAADVASVTGTIDGETVSFEDSPYLWAFGDPDFEQYGWLLLAYQGEFTKAQDLGGTDGLPQVADSWVDYTTASYVDGWIVPGMTEGDPATYSWTVTVQQNTVDNNVYRIKNPYSTCPFMSGTEEGSIVFTVADADLVKVIPGFYSGFSMGGATKIYCFNLEGFYAYQGYTNEVIKAAFAQGREETSTYEGSLVNIPTCVFDSKEAPTSAYTWADENDVSLANFMKASLTLDKPLTAGVGSVSVEDSNAPVEYYNLQGVRVENPESGLYIRRQGNTVTKVMVK